MYTNIDSFEGGGNRAIEYYENDTYGYSVDDLNEENHDESNFETEPSDGMWMEHSTINFSNSAVTSLEYDSNFELLWASYADGRVSSFTMKLDSSVEEYGQPQRYSSFTVSEEPVFQLITLHSYIMSVSMRAIQMHSLGGLSLGKFCSAPTGISEDGEEATFSFTCAAALRPPGALVTAESSGSTHILAGTTSNFAYIYDINIPGGDPLLIYDVGSPTVCVRASDLHLAVAGADGKVRLLDSRLRNLQVTHTFDAHTGPVRDLCLQPDGLTMLTCGVISRPVNPFDPKSPVNYVPDPLVKVFDVRMQRQLSPMSMSVGSPTVLKFVPSGPQSAEDISPASILMGASTGIVQVCPLSGAMIDSQLMYAPLTSRKEVMTAMAVSPSGQVMCVGTSTGAIAQYVLKTPEGIKIKVNESCIIVETPPFAPPAPLMSLSASALVLGSAYMLRPRFSDPTPLASSFCSTPAVRTRRLRLTSARRISDEVIKKTNQQDFIGTVPNIGFRANSMLYGSAAARAYAVCDPRKRLEEAQGKISVNAESGGVVGREIDSSSHGERQSTVGSNSLTKGVSQSSNSVEPSAAIQLVVPATVRRVHSHRGKQRIKEFNYDALNATPFVGLENSAPNAYTNPILQVFFALPEVRECALAAQMAVYHHTNATSLWCELGFLFHMMTAVELYSSAAPVPRVVTPSNFQRTFQQIPESVALGLLDNKESPQQSSVGGGSGPLDSIAATPSSKTPTTSPVSSIDTQQMSQVFCRFMFQQLHREADLAILAKNRSAASQHGLGAGPNSGPLSAPIVAAPNTIDSVFGYSVATTTTFLQSGTIELGSANKVYSLEVVYPILGKNINTRNPRPSPTPSSSSSITPAAVLTCLAASKEKLKVQNSAPSGVLADKIDNDIVSEKMDDPIPSDVTPLVLEVPVSVDGAGPGSAPQDLSLKNVEGIPRISVIAAPAVGAVPSFSSVLWGSYQRETHMRGWCSASETYEPFKQVRSLLSLPKVLTLLCGDTVRDPRDATLSGALGEAQSYGSMHTNFWSQTLDLSHLQSTVLSALTDLGSHSEHPLQLKAPWLPSEIELAVYRSHGGTTGSVYSQGRERAASQGQSASASRGVGVAGRSGAVGKGDRDKLVVSGHMLSVVSPTSGMKEEVWSIYDGATETFAGAAASRLPEYGIMGPEHGDGNSLGWEVFRYSLFAAVSHVVTSVAPVANSSSSSSSSSSVTTAPSTASASSPSSSAVAAVEGPKHSILHIRRSVDGKTNNNSASPANSNSTNRGTGEWWMFNDFVLQPSDEKAAVTFPDWRHPSTLFFGRDDYHYDAQPKQSGSFSPASQSTSALHTGDSPTSYPTTAAAAAALTTTTPTARQIVPVSVLQLPSLSQVPCVRLVASTAPPRNQNQNQNRSGAQREKEREEELVPVPPLPERGDLIAFDGEFVSVQAERVVLNAEGQKVIKEEGRMLLARISIISDGGGNSGAKTDPAYRVLVDDYILPSEPVIDYVTRFSGIVPEDLNPSQSRHAVVPYRTAYLKLRYFLDKGCVFVGHGLQKDFETANIFVPPDQVIDTVELWRLPNKRKTSLRFLAAYLLKADIQDEIHDSIEDAKTALQLYRHYEAVCARGPDHLEATLQDLYLYGARTKWFIGLDKLEG